MNDKEVVKRMEANKKGNSFIKVKDRKENFDNHPTVRQNSPAKNELERISKLILDKISKKISQKFQLNQWKNTDLKWFKQIRNKNLYNLAIFDIKDFYLPVKECLLKNATNFAEISEISEKTKQRYSTLENLYFYVCEAVGNFLLDPTSKNYNKKGIGLHRGDGLAIFKSISGSKTEKIQKIIYKSYLKITT